MQPIENTIIIDKNTNKSTTAPIETKTRDEEMFKFYLAAQDAQYRKLKSE